MLLLAMNSIGHSPASICPDSTTVCPGGPEDTGQALAASELRYRRLFESAKDGILILDADTGKIVDVNPFLTNLLSYSRDEFLGKRVWELGFFKHLAANEEKFTELQAKEYVRYENLPLETVDGQVREVEFVSNVYLADGKQVIQCNIRDITERKRTERMAQDALTTLNRPNNTRNIIRDLLKIIKERTGMVAVGIRLKEGDEFPYYLTDGFPDSFVAEENLLCVRDAAGQMLKDSQGRPVLKGLCGTVLRGQTAAAPPFFTKAGSFWSNCTTDFLASTTDAERPAHARNQHISRGYESVALIPLRAGAETIGLLQLSDHRRDRFTLELITALEWLGASVGVALTRMRAEDHVREQLKELELWHDVTLGREERVIELKQEVNELLAAAGKAPKYSDVEES
jgi:PAS domain S-box-containing protein